MSRDKATLLDIASAAMRILSFIDGLTREGFLEDTKTQSAVLHQLLVLGEATKRLSDELRDEHSEIESRLMAGMWDILIHAYDTVDLDEAWKTATKDVPELLFQIKPLLPADPG